MTSAGQGSCLESPITWSSFLSAPWILSGALTSASPSCRSWTCHGPCPCLYPCLCPLMLTFHASSCCPCLCPCPCPCRLISSCHPCRGVCPSHRGPCGDPCSLSPCADPSRGFCHHLCLFAPSSRFSLYLPPLMLPCLPPFAHSAQQAWCLELGLQWLDQLYHSSLPRHQLSPRQGRNFQPPWHPLRFQCLALLWLSPLQVLLGQWHQLKPGLQRSQAQGAPRPRRLLACCHETSCLLIPSRPSELQGPSTMLPACTQPIQATCPS